MKNVMQKDLWEHIKAFPADFERGVSDCCSFAATWAERVSGTLPGSELLGRGLSDREAMGILRKHGGMEDMVDKMLTSCGWVEVDQWEDGDIVIIHIKNGFLRQSVGVYSQTKVISASERGGVLIVPKPDIARGWRWV